MRIKRFSGYSEAAPGGVSYVPGQVVSKYVLDPLDKGIEKIDKVSDPFSGRRAKDKRDRIRKIIRPLKILIGGKDNS